MFTDRSDSDILNDKIEDLTEENEFLKKQLVILKEQFQLFVQESKKSKKIMIAQYKLSDGNNRTGNQRWDLEILKPSMINGTPMVNRENNNENIVINVDGFYNIILRYGYDDNPSNYSTFYVTIQVNGNTIAQNRLMYICGLASFNEHISLKRNDVVTVTSQRAKNMKKDFNVFTIIRLSD